MTDWRLVVSYPVEDATGIMDAEALQAKDAQILSALGYERPDDSGFGFGFRDLGFVYDSEAEYVADRTKVEALNIAGAEIRGGMIDEEGSDGRA